MSLEQLVDRADIPDDAREIIREALARGAGRERRAAPRAAGENWLIARLRALHDVAFELSLTGSADELCRLAVELGRQRLGFQRLGIWFVADDPRLVTGSYGIDERGRIRDERKHSHRVTPDSVMGRLFAGKMHLIVRPDADLLNHKAEVVGQGTAAQAAIRDGERVIGCISTDDLLATEPWGERHGELLVLLAGYVGGLYTAKRREEALRESEERLRVLFEFAPDAYYLSDLKGVFVDGNRAAEELIGYDKDELIGKNFLKLRVLPPGQLPKAVTLLARNALGRPTGPDEFTLRRKDGTRVPVEVSTYPVKVAGQSLVLGIARDLTERKHSERERLELETQLQHARRVESLSVLAGGLAHEFNNLLMGVLGHAELMRGMLPAQSPAQPLLRNMEAAALRGADLSKQMLAYSGEGAFVIGPIDLSQLVTEAAHLYEPSVPANARVQCELAADLPMVEGDATQLEQALMSLIANAAEAIGDGSGAITIGTGVIDADEEYMDRTYLVDFQLPPARYVYLEVADTGCGMGEETLSRVFEPFFSTKFVGRGLGLAATLGIVRGHKGAIRVRSEPGVGSTFTILLPPTREAAVQLQLTDTETGASAGGMVLVADDESSVRSVARTALERAGYTVVTADDGAEAVEEFKANADNIAAVLLDLSMPKKRGDEVFREIHSLRPDIPVILSSGFTEQEATRRLKGLTPAQFIQKPYRPSELIARLAQLLRGSSD